MGLVHDFNKELSLWFNAHGITNLEFVEGEDFCYYHNQHVVQWGMLQTPRVDANFRQFFYEYGLEYDDVHIFFLSLLHEVGHYMTLHYFSEEAKESDKVAKENRLSDSTIDTDYWYWELPTEFAANMWAINWMNENQELMAELYDFCMERLYAIFSDENILKQIEDWKYDIENGEDYYELMIEEDD